MFSPVLDTPRLTMQNLVPEHPEFVLGRFGHPDACRYLVDAPPVRTPADAEEIIAIHDEAEQRLRNRWVFVSKADSRPIGTLGFHVFDLPNRAIEVGYDLNPTHWGRGLMSEALTGGLDHVFSELGVFKAEAWVHVANGRSSALLVRHGFTREGTIRAKYFFDGAWHDHHLYGLLKPDRIQDRSNS